MSFKNIIFWNIVLIFNTLYAIFAVITLYEFYNVAILNNVRNYPWGLEHENPWYYINGNTYENVMLAEGIIFSTCTITIFYQFIKLRKMAAFYAVLISTFIFILSIVNGNYKYL